MRGGLGEPKFVFHASSEITPVSGPQKKKEGPVPKDKKEDTTPKNGSTPGRRGTKKKIGDRSGLTIK